MKKFTFKIYGDNAEKINVPYDGEMPILLVSTFYTNEGYEGAEKIADDLFNAFNNPQRVGAPMARSTVYQENDL